MAVVNAFSDNISIFLNDGLGNLGVATNIGVTALDGLFEIEARDLNNDTFADLIATKSGSDEVTVLLSNGMARSSLVYTSPRINAYFCFRPRTLQRVQVVAFCAAS